MNDTGATLPRPQPKAAVKRPVSAAEIPLQGMQGSVRHASVPAQLPVALRKQPDIAIPARDRPLPTTRIPEPPVILPPVRPATLEVTTTAEAKPLDGGMAAAASGEPVTGLRYSPAAYLLLRFDVKALASGETRPVALVRLSETQGRSALASLSIKGQLVQRSPAEALAHVLNGRDAAAIFAADNIVEQLSELSLDGIRAIPLVGSPSSP